MGTQNWTRKYGCSCASSKIRKSCFQFNDLSYTLLSLLLFNELLIALMGPPSLRSLYKSSQWSCLLAWLLYSTDRRINIVRHQGNTWAGEGRRGNNRKWNWVKKERELVEGEAMWRCRVNDAMQKVITRRNTLWWEKAGRKQSKLYNKQVSDVALEQFSVFRLTEREMRS